MEEGPGEVRNAAGRFIRGAVVVIHAAAICAGTAAACVSGEDPTDSLVQRAGRALLEARHEQVIRILGPMPDSTLTPQALSLLGAAYASLNDAERALRCLRMAVERDSTTPGYRLQLARMLTAAGCARDADVQHRAILRRDPLFLPSLFSLGLSAIERKEYPAAAANFRTITGKNPRDYLALYYLGHCYASMDSLDSARTFLAASLTLNTRYGPTLELLASLYYRSSDYRQALRLYRTASREFPDRAEYWYHQGLCLEKFEDWHEARDCYRRSISLDSTSSLSFAHLGQVYFELKRFDSSAAAYEQAVRIDEENPVLFLNLGLAYARARELPEAEQAFRNAISAQDPEQVAKVYNQLGALYFVWERLRDARDSYRRALLYQPANLEALFYLAVSLDQLREYTSAANAYRTYLTRAAKDQTQTERVKITRERLKQLKR
jgi:tetratricopeptide (TPR) repeat protein